MYVDILKHIWFKAVSFLKIKELLCCIYSGLKQNVGESKLRKRLD